MIILTNKLGMLETDMKIGVSEILAGTAPSFRFPSIHETEKTPIKRVKNSKSLVLAKDTLVHE